jgi:hypothetical protein
MGYLVSTIAIRPPEQFQPFISTLATKVPSSLAMNRSGCVVLFGDFSDERLDLAAIGQDFSWSVAQARDLVGFGEIGRTRTVIAVLVQAGSLRMPWPDVIRTIRAVAPRARIIVCHKVEQVHFRTEMVDSGAFGVLLSPLAQSEVRQSLGFVWASKITPMPHVPSATKKIRRIDAPMRRLGAA